MTFKDALEKIRRKRPALAKTFVPAELGEILQLQETRVSEFPEDFVAFLEAMGRGTGDLRLRGVDSGHLKIDIRRMLIKPRRGKSKPVPDEMPDEFPLGEREDWCQDCGAVYVEGMNRNQTRIIQIDETERHLLAESIGDYVYRCCFNPPAPNHSWVFEP